MKSTRKPCFVISILLVLLLVSTVHGDQLADARGTGGRMTVRTGAVGHGHGYSSHSGHGPNGGTPEQGGAGAVDPRNPNNGRSHHRNAAEPATRAPLASSPLPISVLLGAIFAMFLV
ncbi:hypothetical protein ACP4OV_006998 [Aristida adscensionis]